MPPQKLPPESHYDHNKLGKLFALAAVVLLLSLIGQFAKAQYDALKYRVDTAANEHKPNAEALKRQLEDLGAKIEKIRLKVEADTDAVKAKQSALTALQKDIKTLEKKKGEFTKKQDI